MQFHQPVRGVRSWPNDKPNVFYSQKHPRQKKTHGCAKEAYTSGTKPYFRKKALYLRKRALYTCRASCRISAKRQCRWWRIAATKGHQCIKRELRLPCAHLHMQTFIQGTTIVNAIYIYVYIYIFIYIYIYTYIYMSMHNETFIQGTTIGHANSFI